MNHSRLAQIVDDLRLLEASPGADRTYANVPSKAMLDGVFLVLTAPDKSDLKRLQMAFENEKIYGYEKQIKLDKASGHFGSLVAAVGDEVERLKRILHHAGFRDIGNVASKGGRS